MGERQKERDRDAERGGKREKERQKAATLENGRKEETGSRRGLSLKGTFCICFVGIEILGDLRKLGCWPHPGVPGCFTAVGLCGTVGCLLALVRCWQSRGQG